MACLKGRHFWILYKNQTSVFIKACHKIKRYYQLREYNFIILIFKWHNKLLKVNKKYRSTNTKMDVINKQFTKEVTKNSNLKTCSISLCTNANCNPSVI